MRQILDGPSLLIVFLWFSMVSLLTHVGKIVAIRYFFIHIYLYVDLFVLFWNWWFLHPLRFVFQLSFWPMFVIVASFTLSVYFSENVVKYWVSEIDLSQLLLDKKEPKRCKNKGSDYINWVMNSRNS